LQDSQFVNLILNNTNPIFQSHALPITLTTTGLQLLIPHLTDYGHDKFVYLNISFPNTVQNIQFRAGRMAAQLDLNLNFIVDKDGSNYPQDPTNWTSCESALTIQTTLYLSLSLYNIYPMVLGGVVHNLEFPQITIIDSSIPFDNKQFASILNSMVGGSILPNLNSKLAAGIPLPNITEIIG